RTTEDRPKLPLEANPAAPGEAGEARAGIVVRCGSPGSKEEQCEIPAPSLKEAILIAQGNQGYVELRNRQPLRLDAAEVLDLAGLAGTVDIRAAPETVPIVIIPIGASRSFLTTGSKVNLKLSGLDIRVRYVTSPGNAPAVPTPLIEAGGPVSIRRCAF